MRARGEKNSTGAEEFGTDFNATRQFVLDVMFESREYGDMKTTLEMPDELFEKAQVCASAKGIELKAFLNEAVEAHVSVPGSAGGTKPWIKVFDDLPRDDDFHAEMKRIDALIETEFERLDPEDKQ